MTVTQDRPVAPDLPASLVWAIAGPVVAGIAIVVLFVVAELGGRPVFTDPAPANIAEAAGTGSAAETLRRLRAGEDPTVLESVRPDVIASTITRVTGLEAAVWSRRVELVRMIDRERPIRGAMRQELACLAVAARAQETAAYLAPSGVSGCDPDQVVQREKDRSR